MDQIDPPFLWHRRHARLRCPTTLVVICDSGKVARWAERPIEIGHGIRMCPVVIGPRDIPCHFSVEQCRRTPALPVLAVVAHGRGAQAQRVGRMALDAIRPWVEAKHARAMLYVDVIYAYLDEAVLIGLLEDEMNLGYQPISPYFKRIRAEGLAEGRAEGRAEGMVQMLERLLQRLGHQPSDEHRQQMARCRDPAQLQCWFDRAMTATSVAEVFDL